MKQLQKALKHGVRVPLLYAQNKQEATFVMEHLQGPSAREYIDGEASEEVVLEMMKWMGKAVSGMHVAGIGKWWD